MSNEITPAQPLTDARTYKVAQVVVRTVQEATLEEPAVLNRAELVAQFFQDHVQTLASFDPEVESFWVFLLNQKNRLKMFGQITSGTATATLCHPREVFRAAVMASAAAIVVVHNHPSGDPAPSGADLAVTRQLREAARTLEITLCDHVIIGRAGADPTGKGFYSFREAGLL